MEIFKFLINPDFYTSVIQLSIPLILAGLAALITNKAGILNISIEGSMLISALMGAIVGYNLHSAILGLLAAILTGMLFGYLLSIFVNKLKIDFILVGIALNLLATGLVTFIIFSITGIKGDYPSVSVPNLYIPLLSDIPFVGKILFSQNLLVYLTIILIIIFYIMLNKTTLGIRIKAVGENPLAAKSMGINTFKITTYALIIGGALAGLGGAFLSMGYMSIFNTGMIAGRGFIGIAAESMGAGLTFNTIIAATIFGLVNAIANQAQVSLSIPFELINTLPYVVTIIGLVIYSLRKRKQKGENQ